MATDVFISSVARSIKHLVDEHGLTGGWNSFTPGEIDDRSPMQVGRVARQYRAALNRALASHKLLCVEVYKKGNRTFLKIEAAKESA